jgi:30S ribosomal protein S31
MGKGDKKTKRGKIIMGSYGKNRPRKKKEKEANSAKVEEKIVSDNKKG